ncbi:uncharacterized protein LOC129290380 isoform X2 [Prosopis cineraria]|uniref:uncharacterized protein LOC129290380 isoform X2 n=1 Tax=Prosopis cineraria TaxID=364024 RepID=UPI00240EE28F|nr:uncharacterized protein LOC129290380 isoform X2 [Prosopis cineraria]
MDFYDVDNDRSSNQTLLFSSVLSLTLNAENRNKFGLGFSPASFHVYHQDFHIGTIRIPRFFQPPHSDDVVVRCRVLLEGVNVTKILGKASETAHDDEPKGNISEMKILGDVKAHLWFLHLNLINIKLAMDCDMNVNLKEITSSNYKVYSAKMIKSRLAFAFSNSRAITMKCVSALSI